MRSLIRLLDILYAYFSRKPSKKALCIRPGCYESPQVKPKTEIMLAGRGQIIIDDYFGFIDLVTTPPSIRVIIIKFE